MRRNVLLGAVGLGIAGLFIAGPVALAEQSQGNDADIAVDKAAYLPGETVRLTGVCRMEGVATWTVKSKAFQSAAEVRSTGRGTDEFAGTARIGKRVRPGTYTISFPCAGDTTNARITVKGRPVTLQSARTVKANAQLAVNPKGAANNGDLTAAAPVRERVSNTGLYVAGGSALLAAGGAGGLMLRRRSRAQN